MAPIARSSVGVAAWLIFEPVLFIVNAPESHGEIDYGESNYLHYLGPNAHVTTKISDAWLGTTVALLGLWAWQRQLTRRGASLEQLGAWGSLIASDTEGAVRKWKLVGLTPVTLLILAKVLTGAASTAVISSVTLSLG